MQVVGAFIAVAGILLFVTRAPGVFVPRTYRKFAFGLFDNFPRLVKWIGRCLLLYAALFIAATSVNFSQLTPLSVIFAVCIQLAFFTGGMFLQFPAAAKEIAMSFLPEEAGMTRLILFLASAFGACVGAYGILLILEA